MISILELAQGFVFVAVVGLLTRGAIRLNLPVRRPRACPFILGLLSEGRGDSRDGSDQRAR